jgi:hypothetical protein
MAKELNHDKNWIKTQLEDYSKLADNYLLS